MSETSETTEERRAAERLAWKAEERDGTPLFRTITADRERREAQDLLDIGLPLLVDRDRSRRDKALRDAAGIIGKEARMGHGVDGDLQGNSHERFRTAMAKADSYTERLARLEAIGDEKRATLSATIKREERVYGEGRPSSWVLDVARSSLPGFPGHAEALGRLERYGHELSVEARAGTAEGRRALQVLASRNREEGVVRTEQRALTSGSASFGAFVTPAYLVKNWAAYRTYAPSFLEQTTKVPDPGYGLEMLIPAFTSPADVAAQSAELAGVARTDISAEYVTANLLTFSGEMDVSQQLLDRTGPGVGFDQVAYSQMMVQLETEIDTFALTQALANAGSVAGASAFTVPALWGDMAKAKAQMQTAAGTVLAPTALFLAPAFYEWAASQVDSNNRPLVTPTPAGASLPIALGPDGTPPCGFTGERVLTTPTFTNGNIPTVADGTGTQLVFAHMPEVFSMTSTPTARAIPETLAQSLTVVVQLFAYAGVIPRYANAVQSLTGAAYAAAPSFA